MSSAQIYTWTPRLALVFLLMLSGFFVHLAGLFFGLAGFFVSLAGFLETKFSKLLEMRSFFLPHINLGVGK